MYIILPKNSRSIVLDIRYLSIISSLFGIVLAYSYIYAYHIFALVFISLYILNFFNCYKKLILINWGKILLWGMLFTFYLFLSSFWSGNVINSFRHIFYIICGLVLIWIVVDYINNEKFKLNKIFNTFCIIMLIQLIIGLLESFGIIRLPMSPFSPYNIYFGREGIDKSDFFLDELNKLYELPTGFTGNPNNFSFIMLLSLPFIILFFKRNIFKILILYCVLYIIIASDSRGLLLCYFIMGIISLVLFLIKNYRKKSSLYFVILCLLIFFIFFSYLEEKLLIIAEEINSLFDFLQYGNIVGYDSIGARAYIYREGFFQFLDNPWFGKGIGGMQNYLVEHDFPVKSFHYFPFELLIDIGLISFIIIAFFYIKLLFSLFKIYIFSFNQYYVDLAYVCLISLLLYPIASIVPSSTVYIWPFWFILGFSLALVNIGKK